MFDRFGMAAIQILGGESGQTLSEYALIFAFIVLAGMTALGLLAVGLDDPYDALTSALPG
jgi:Flp pilus assembly pilin Flp